MIRSRHNTRLKDIRRLRRSKGRRDDDHDRALLEGPHLVEEALTADLALETVLATPEFLESDAGRRLIGLLPRAPLTVDAALLDEMADSDSPRGIVATTRLPHRGLEDLPAVEGTYVYAEGLQDPGNLGALARVAEAAGAVGLFLSPGCCHPNHPRALRASAGSLLRLPVAVGVDLDAVNEHLAPLAPRWAALVPRGGRDLWEADLSGCVVVVLGAEGPGVSSVTRGRADVEVTIPLAGGVESLNATVAAAVVLFEIYRGRAGR